MSDTHTRNEQTTELGQHHLPCPRPDKKAFGTRAAAKAFNSGFLASAASLKVYYCRCGRYHVGNRHHDPTNTIRATAHGDLTALDRLRNQLTTTGATT